MMKNIGASVGAVPTQEKKEVEKKIVEEEVEGEIKEEECIPMKNEMIFFLNEAPEYQISAVAVWGENARGDVVREPDTYFRHILTGARCESAWSCLIGWSEPDEHAAEKWEELCGRIEELENTDEIICDEKRVGL